MYVGNLDYQTTDEDLLNAFSAFGSVLTANVVRNAETGHAKGFGFVEMKEQAEANAALAGLEGSEIRGRSLTVRQEKPISYESGSLPRTNEAR